MNTLRGQLVKKHELRVVEMNTFIIIHVALKHQSVLNHDAEN